MPQSRRSQINRLLRKSPSPLVNIAGGALRGGVDALSEMNPFKLGKKAGEDLAETVLGPPDYSPVRAGLDEVEYQQSAPSGPPALEPRYRLPLRDQVNIRAGVWNRERFHQALPTMPDPDPNQAFAREFPDMSKSIQRKSLGLAPEDQAPPAPIGGLYDTGGLDRGDPTSFAPPKEEFEPAYVKRDRETERKQKEAKKKAELKRIQRQSRAR